MTSGLPTIYGANQAVGDTLMAFNMRLLFTLFMLVPSVLIVAPLQNEQPHSEGANSSTTSATLADLSKLARETHERGDVEGEITLRREFSRKVWEMFAVDPNSLSKYDRYNIVDLNDLLLGLLLEGSHRLSEAEAVFRHNQAELAPERIAGNDIKSENELYLAQVLALEGNVPEANKICSYWKSRMRHLAAGQDSDHWHGEPRAPLYNTPEVETATWDLACGSSDKGLRLLSEQIQAHPGMLAPYTVLTNFYLAKGDFQKALATEKEGTTALLHRTNSPTP
jgi:hypothetical protein